jgi:hypothetical protein
MNRRDYFFVIQVVFGGSHLTRDKRLSLVVKRSSWTGLTNHVR